jgi:hypothetical protein
LKLRKLRKMVVLYGNAPYSYAHLAIKCFIRAPAFFKLQDQIGAASGNRTQNIYFTKVIGYHYINAANLEQRAGLEPALFHVGSMMPYQLGERCIKSYINNYNKFLNIGATRRYCLVVFSLPMRCTAFIL